MFKMFNPDVLHTTILPAARCQGARLPGQHWQPWCSGSQAHHTRASPEIEALQGKGPLRCCLLCHGAGSRQETLAEHQQFANTDRASTGLLETVPSLLEIS